MPSCRKNQRDDIHDREKEKDAQALFCTRQKVLFVQIVEQLPFPILYAKRADTIKENRLFCQNA